jgi:homoserine O-acetyltransferase
MLKEVFDADIIILPDWQPISTGKSVEKNKETAPKIWYHNHAFKLESGEILPDLHIAYHTYGTLNVSRDNVVWICHALTANSDVADWWSGLVGEGKFFDPANNFIVCANMIGSHYGSTSPLSIDKRAQTFFAKNFPIVTVRDIARAHQLLAEKLGIKKIKIAVGGSMGGQQVLEWAILQPDLFDKIALIACGAQMTPWSIALNETQRMAIEADPTFDDEVVSKIETREALIKAGAKGMEAARAIGMLSYRSYTGYNLAQADDSDNIDAFRVQTYQRYQAEKLRKRFSALCYESVSKTMDTHNVGRNRGGVALALKRVKAKTLVVGIQTDILFPLEEQIILAAHIPNARLEVIQSKFGHDGFLIEFDQMHALLTKFLAN